MKMIDGRSLIACCALGVAASAFSAEAGYRILVTNEGSGDLTVIDGGTHRVSATWPLGKRPRGVVGAPGKQRLYVALTGSPLAGPGVDEKSLPPADKAADGIGIVRLSDGRVERVLTGVSDPEQVALSPDGTRLFVASEDTGVAAVINVGTWKNREQSRRRRRTRGPHRERRGRPSGRHLRRNEFDHAVGARGFEVDCAPGRRPETSRSGVHA